MTTDGHNVTVDWKPRCLQILVSLRFQHYCINNIRMTRGIFTTHVENDGIRYKRDHVHRSRAEKETPSTAAVRESRAHSRRVGVFATIRSDREAYSYYCNNNNNIGTQTSIEVAECSNKYSRLPIDDSGDGKSKKQNGRRQRLLD